MVRCAPFTLVWQPTGLRPGWAHVAVGIGGCVRMERRGPSHGSDEIVAVVALLVLMVGLVWLVVVRGCMGHIRPELGTVRDRASVPPSPAASWGG